MTQCRHRSHDLLLEMDGSCNLRREYTYYPGIDRPHSVREHASGVAGRYYFTMELPGHVSGLLNASGQMVNEYRYSPFGKPLLVQEGVPNPLRYMSREWDADAGLYYVRNRWYDPEVGRFISEDPIGLAGGINAYAYAWNDPISHRDPLGLEPCRVIIYYEINRRTGRIVPYSVRILDWIGDCGQDEAADAATGGRAGGLTECEAMAGVASAIGGATSNADDFIHAFEPVQ